MKKLCKIAAIMLSVSMMLVGCSSKQETNGTAENGEKKFKVALLLSGPANDQGWNATALEGLNQAESEHGVETAYMENVQIADAEAAYTDYAAQGYDLIIGHGFQFGEPAARVAAKFPDISFMATESNSQADNMASYIMSCEQGAYIMGILSASMSKSGKIGVVGGIEQPSIVKELEAFKIAAKEVNPNIEVFEIYVNSFTDVNLGKEAAMSMISNGADVLYHVANQAGTGVIKAAEENKVLVCGNSYDQSSISPDYLMASTIYNMPKVIVTAVDQLKKGEFKGGVFNLGMADGVVEISGYNTFEDKIPEDVKQKIEDTKKAIIDGSLSVPVIEKPTK